MRQLKIFKNFSYLIQLLSGTIIDMVDFLIILFLFVLVFTLLDMAIHKGIEGKEGFFYNYGSLYQTWMGENPGLNIELQDWLVYFFFTNLVNIIALNLLISIISNTYDKIQATADAQNCMIKAQILSEIGALLFVNRVMTKQSFIHIALNANESIDEPRDGNEWEGRVKVLSKKQDHIMTHLHQVEGKVDGINSDVSDIRCQMTKMMDMMEMLMKKE